MATGTTSDFKMTRNELIELALSRVGVVEPSTDDISISVKVLNSLVRSIDAKATWLWAVDASESTIQTVGGQSAYITGTGASNIPLNMLELIEIAISRGDERRQLVIYNKQDALKSYLKTGTNSEPLAAYFERAVDRVNNKLFLYPTPNSSYDLKYSYRRPLFDFDSPSDNPDFPSEWALALQKMLSYELAPHFGKSLNERQILKADYDLGYKEVESFSADRPSYTTLKTEFF